MPPPQNCWHGPAMLNSTVLFDIAVDGEPLGHISLSCLQTKFLKEQRTFVFWAPGTKDVLTKFPAFTGLFWDWCGRVVTSHAIMALAASTSMGRNLRMRIPSWSTQVLASCPWKILDPTQTFPSASSVLPQLSGWRASMWCLSRWRRAWTL